MIEPAAMRSPHRGFEPEGLEGLQIRVSVCRRGRIGREPLEDIVDPLLIESHPAIDRGRRADRGRPVIPVKVVERVEPRELDPIQELAPGEVRFPFFDRPAAEGEGEDMPEVELASPAEGFPAAALAFSV